MKRATIVIPFAACCAAHAVDRKPSVVISFIENLGDGEVGRYHPKTSLKIDRDPGHVSRCAKNVPRNGHEVR